MNASAQDELVMSISSWSVLSNFFFQTTTTKIFIYGVFIWKPFHRIILFLSNTSTTLAASCFESGYLVKLELTW
jgi:hypothetical protein